MKKPYAYRPFSYFLYTNLITWGCFIVVAWYSYQNNSRSINIVSGILEVIGVLAPFVVTLWMIFTSKNAELKQDYFDKLFNFKLIKLSSIPAVLLIIPASQALSIFLSSFFGESMGQFELAKGALFSAGIIPVPVMLFGAACFEELGWKGYGMDSLRSKYNFFIATLIFGALWAFWHLPLFLVNGYYQNILLKTDYLFAANFIISIFPAAFIINWLWYKNGGNILTAIVLHSLLNLQGLFQMEQTTKCIETVVLSIVAITIVWCNRDIFFKKPSGTIGIANDTSAQERNSPRRMA